MDENERKALKKSPPWVSWVSALRALFSADPQVWIKYDNERDVKLFVSSAPKAEALRQLLPETVEFGNVTLNVGVVPANVQATKADLFQQAFAGNEIVKGFIPVENVFTNPVVYMVFKREVVQFWDDDLGDPHGNRTTLYQEIAKDIFQEHGGVLFCTDND